MATTQTLYRGKHRSIKRSPEIIDWERFREITMISRTAEVGMVVRQDPEELERYERVEIPTHEVKSVQVCKPAENHETVVRIRPNRPIVHVGTLR